MFPALHCTIRKTGTCDDINAARCQQDLGDATSVAAQRHALQATRLLQGWRPSEEAG